MPEVVTTDLCRSMPFKVTREAGDTDGDDGRTLTGYGAVFNTPTRIDSWEGTFDETIAPGAFKKSLSERTPKLQYDHGSHPLIGSIPIGKITDIREDSEGLRVVARLSDNWLVEPVRDAIRDGAVEGMSFRFSVVRDEWRTKDGTLIKDPKEVASRLWENWGESLDENEVLTRTLKEVKISEVGPVTWPAYEETSVAVRSKVTIDLARLRDPEQRAKLARAVLLADAAVRSDADAGPGGDDELPETNSPDDTTPEDQTATSGEETPEVAVDHDEDSTTDTPQTTEDDDNSSAGEHESGETSPDPADNDGASETDVDEQARAAINAGLIEIREALALTLTRQE